MGGKIEEALVDLDAAGNPTPVMAQSRESSADGKPITFKLRAGVTWHDGRPFASADVAFTAMEMWKKILNYGTSLQLFLTAVDTPDPLTAIFRHERPMPLGLLLRALPDLGCISPEHIYEVGDIRQNPANTAPIGNGPIPSVSTHHYPPGRPQYPFDAALANRLLDEAGHRRGAGASASRAHWP